MKAALSARTAVLPPPDGECVVNHDACDRRIAELEHDLRTVAEHWPGKFTGRCMGCDDAAWPCIHVDRVMAPHLDAIDAELAAAIDEDDS